MYEQYGNCPYASNEYGQRQFNQLEYANSMAGSLLGLLGNATPYGMRDKPRHIQLLEEARERHPEWAVKRKETR